jgi:hypothetical protein
MIEHQQTVYSWQFTFLAANQDAFAAGQSMGIGAAGIAGFVGDKIGAAYTALAGKALRMRRDHAAGHQVSNDFTDEERNQMQ